MYALLRPQIRDHSLPSKELLMIQLNMTRVLALLQMLTALALVTKTRLLLDQRASMHVDGHPLLSWRPLGVHTLRSGRWSLPVNSK